MDIVKSENRSYARYEEVLIRRDNLRKQAEQYNLDFIREFGDLITRSFELKIECIRKKKVIAYCQRLANRGRQIKRNELTAYIEKEMLEYRAELEKIIRDVKAVRDAKAISALELRKIKEIYYALVKLIHPDLHPELVGDDVIGEYWQRIAIAYTYNRLKDLQEVDMLVRRYLADKGLADPYVEIEGIEEKIFEVEREIEEIISTNPYLYKLILDDVVETKRKKQEYEAEIEAYTRYSSQLDEVINTFDIKEMLS